jgi:hypothetical protein
MVAVVRGLRQAIDAVAPAIAVPQQRSV